MQTTRGLSQVCLVLLILCGSVAAKPSQAARGAAALPVYVALGDSLTSCIGVDDPTTQCYPALLASHLPHGARLRNVAIAGEIAVTAVFDELPRALRAKPTLATVWLGSNDVGLSPLGTFKTALDRVLTALQATHARLFVATLPDFRQIGPFRDQAAAEGPFNAAVRALAARHGATVVDVYAASKSLWGHPANVFNDGSHLSPAGQRILAEVFYRVLHSSGAL